MNSDLSDNFKMFSVFTLSPQQEFFWKLYLTLWKKKITTKKPQTKSPQLPVSFWHL